MTIEQLAADLAARVPELARDCPQNRQTLIANLLREAFEQDYERRYQEFIKDTWHPPKPEITCIDDFQFVSPEQYLKTLLIMLSKP